MSDGRHGPARVMHLPEFSAKTQMSDYHDKWSPVDFRDEFNEVHGRLVGTRTPDLHRVKVAL
jgi:hypothetical protein